MVEGSGWACGDTLLRCAHVSHQFAAQGLPKIEIIFWYLLAPSPPDYLQVPQQPVAGPSNTDLHKPQRPWSCLGVQPAILLIYFWDGKNKDEFHIQSVHSLWIYTYVESIFSCTVLLANACREFVPHCGSHSSQNTFLGVIQRGVTCHNLEPWCEVLQELRHLSSYPI